MEAEETRIAQSTWELTDALETLEAPTCCGVNCCCGKQ